MNRRIRGRASQRRFFVQYDAHRHLREQIGIAPLGGESAQKFAVGQLAQNFRRDAAADVNPAERFRPEREVSCLRAVRGDEQIQRLDADFRFLRQRRL